MSKKALMVDLHKVTIGLQYDENLPMKVVLGIPVKEKDADGSQSIDTEKMVDVTEEFFKMYEFINALVKKKMAEAAIQRPKIVEPTAKEKELFRG